MKVVSSFAGLLATVGLWAGVAQAQLDTSAPSTPSTPELSDLASAAGSGIPEYYTFAESTPKAVSFTAPDEVFQDFVAAVKNGLNLLSWVHHAEMFPAPQTKYQRVGQFGTWINDPTDESCMNTRAQVLVRDSKVDVTYRRTNKCLVATGQWEDPYAGEEMTKSQEVQIDHVVPLKNAYKSGAYKWDNKARCLYANFMGTNYNLLPVDGHENMSKGDSGPEDYMPPRSAVRCEYLTYWLKIKATWNLVMTKDEAKAVQKLVRDNNCQTSDFVLSAKELHEVRSYIQQHLADCGS